MNELVELIEQLRKGNVVLFLGAGVSVDAGLPGGDELARELAERAELDPLGGRWSLPETAQVYELQHGRHSLLDYVTHRIDDPQVSPGRAHALIAAMPFDKIVTTNWDNLLEEALRAQRKPFVKVARDSDIAFADEKKVLVIKLHGSVEQKDTLVVTGDDYYDVFARLPEAANLVQVFFATKTILFLGFGLADEDFKRLYHEVVRHLGRHMRRAYAVQQRPDELTVRYWEYKNILVIDAKTEDFLRGLVESLAEPVAPVVEVTEPPQELPKRKEYLDFVLRIGKGPATTTWTTSSPLILSSGSPAGEATTTTTLPMELSQAAERVAHLPPTETEEATQLLKEVGQDLFRVLDTGEIGAHYRESKDLAASRGMGLRLTLEIDSPELAALPWELMYDEKTDEFLSLSDETLPFRYRPYPTTQPPLLVSPPLHLLVIVSSPHDSGLDPSVGRALLENALGPVLHEGRLRVELVERGTMRALRQALRLREYHILHLATPAAHENGAPVLLFEDDDGRATMVEAEMLAKLLAGTTVKLVTVMTHASPDSARGSFEDLARTLLALSPVSAVVASQYRMDDEATATFYGAFYRLVADGYPIDLAVAEAKKEMRIQEPQSIAWAAPTLFSSVRNGVIFEMEGAEVGEETIATILRDLESQQVSVRRNAAEALRTMDSAQLTPAVVEDLIPFLSRDDATVRRAVVTALGRVAPELTGMVVEPLIEALGDEDTQVQRSTVETLGVMGAEDEEVETALLAALAHADTRKRANAAAALGEMRSTRALDPLIAALGAEDALVRRNAARALGKIGHADAVAPLLDRLQDEDEFVRREAAEALGEMRAHEAESYLIPLLYDRSAMVRSSAVGALGRVGSEEAVPPLTRLVDDSYSDSSLRQSAGEALNRIRTRLSRLQRQVEEQLRGLIKAFFEEASFQVADTGRDLMVTPTQTYYQDYGPIVVRYFPNGDIRASDIRRIVEDTQRSRDALEGKIAFAVASGMAMREVYPQILAYKHGVEGFTVIPLSLSVVEKALRDRNCLDVVGDEIDRWMGRIDLYADARPIADPMKFYGRKALLGRLTQTLDSLQHIGLFGMRKVGKTSVIFRLEDTLKTYPTAHIDLQRAAIEQDCRELYSLIISELKEDIAFKYKEVALPELKISAEHPVRYFREDLLRIKDTLQSILPAFKILIFLDEIDVILPAEGEAHARFGGYNDFLGMLRGLAQDDGLLASVVVSVRPDVNRVPVWEGKDNRVWQFYREVFLDPFDEDETKLMVRTIGEQMGVEYTEESLGRIYQEAGGHPFVTRTLCSCLIEGQGRPLRVEVADVESSVARYIRSGTYSAYFQGELWTKMSQAERMILAGLAQGHDIAPRWDGSEALSRLLETFVVLRRDGDYDLSMKLFERWIRVKQLGLEA